MTLKEAQDLCVGQTIYHATATNARGLPCALKVTHIKKWKTRPDEIEIHTKYGFYEHNTFTERSLACLTLTPIYKEQSFLVKGHFLLVETNHSIHGPVQSILLCNGTMFHGPAFDTRLKAKRYINKHFSPQGIGALRWTWNEQGIEQSI